MMNVESDFQGMFYVHSPSDGVLIPANTFGRKFALLPQPKAGVSTMAQYQVCRFHGIKNFAQVVLVHYTYPTNLR